MTAFVFPPLLPYENGIFPPKPTPTATSTETQEVRESTLEREREMSASTRKKVQRKCKIRGYTLKVDALDEILSFVSRFDGPDEDEAIDLLLDQLEHESCNFPISIYLNMFIVSTPILCSCFLCSNGSSFE